MKGKVLVLVKSAKSTQTDKTTLKKESVLTLHLNFGAADVISKSRMWNVKYLL